MLLAAYTTASCCQCYSLQSKCPIIIYEATKVAASIETGFSYVPRVFMKLTTAGAAGCIINAPKSIF
jgi:hypothetical protein